MSWAEAYKKMCQKRWIGCLLLLCVLLSLVSCAGSQSANTDAERISETAEPKDERNSDDWEAPAENAESTQQEAESTASTEEAMKMNVQIGNNVFTATLEENEAVDALVKMMEDAPDAPIVIEMRDYSGFEKVGALGTSLPSSNSQTTTQAGDIVLYNDNQIVIFYGSNAWSYTRLGHIDDLTGWEEALGSGDVTVVFSLN